jgi:hypothetical protein
MDGGVITFVIAILIIGVFLFIAFGLTGKRGHKFDMREYQARFLAIENKLNRENPATFETTIINCDKLLDRALIEMGIPGKTMGDRLKRCGTKFNNLDAVWRAHKMRNMIAHESDFELTYKQAQNAVEVYKQALKDLGAI